MIQYGRGTLLLLAREMPIRKFDVLSIQIALLTIIAGSALTLLSSK